MRAYARHASIDPIQRDRLIAEHAETARRIALHVARRVPDWISRDDLVAAALLGLAEAAERYDEGRQEPFLAFAEKRIRGAVLDELRRGDFMPRRVRQKARHVGETVRSLEQKLGRAPEDEEVAAALGVDFALPEDAPEELDLVVHTSATSAGLQRSLDLLAAEGTVVDLSWYGDTEVRLSLGGAFHARRLTIRSSQVGTLSPTRASRRKPADRLALALELLRDPAFDALLTGESRFDELPAVMARLAAGSLPALCHTITYAEG